MKKLLLLYLSLFGGAALSPAQESSSLLNPKDFSRLWLLEAESPETRTRFSGDTLELVSPKGATLWFKEKLSGDATIEYDACIMDEGLAGDRLSDLNCFWMASDPRNPNRLFRRSGERGGVFARYYALQLYYLGYGGNGNTTTRFRRYDGKEAAVTDSAQRPAVLTEYTDAEHLLKPNRWVRIRIENRGNRVCYYINGKRIVDYRDAAPLRQGWFGLRTTAARLRVTGFRCSLPEEEKRIALRWIGETPLSPQSVSWGVPFSQGEVQPAQRLLLTADGEPVAAHFFPLACWGDGSVKWGGVSAVIPCDGRSQKLSLEILTEKQWKKRANALSAVLKVQETAANITVNTGEMTVCFSKEGDQLWDSLLLDGQKAGDAARMVCQTRRSREIDTGEMEISVTEHYRSIVKKLTVESSNPVRAVIRAEGMQTNGRREWLPFTVRLYFYAGTRQIKMVHSFVFDGEASSDFISAIGVRFTVPLREELYNRHIAFSGADGGVWSEPVQPLVGRRILSLPGENGKERTPLPLQVRQMQGEAIPEKTQFDAKNQSYLNEWVSWSDYRLSQLNDKSFSVRKRTQTDAPWIGTFTSTRSTGTAFVGDVSGGLAVCLQDFWQSYPTALEVTGARTAQADLTVWLWSPESEPMNLCHYDTAAHGLESSYEDVQEGLSTPYGIARTHTLQIEPQTAYPGKEAFARTAQRLSADYQIACTPEYLHRKHAFGIWSLPDTATALRSQIEARLKGYVDFYKEAIDEHGWYGFWNYGDVMHAYDAARHEWRYDVGGYAWDNTELASNMWLWYNFLRSGDADCWRMAVAMTRHTGEVDVYHTGPLAGLGSRHNVSHWGCGAKEARISQAAWNRFYYYLTADERCGDLMHAVTDADRKLYTLDPMRLAQPREKYPCTAPARLRIGPDWIAYAGNWMAEWERTGNTLYRDKIVAGMKSIAAMPHGIFTGPMALGYDPATGILSYEGDTALQSTNHLLPLMGGFEVMNEMMEMIELPEWKRVWLDLCANYREKAVRITRNRFPIPRLSAYAAYLSGDAAQRDTAWRDLIGERKEGELLPRRPVYRLFPPEVPSPRIENPFISTNDVATWSLDAIYMLEVCPIDN